MPVLFEVVMKCRGVRNWRGERWREVHPPVKVHEWTQSQEHQRHVTHVNREQKMPSQQGKAYFLGNSIPPNQSTCE